MQGNPGQLQMWEEGELCQPNPFITIEIFGNELMQAYHRYNSDCTKEEEDWIKDYCERHGIGHKKFRFNAEVDMLF